MAAKKPENRDKAGRFVKGKSGNPGGRKPMDGETKKILEDAAPEAAQMLVAMMNNAAVNPQVRIKAAETILDRVYGKPTQAIEGEIDNVIEIKMGGASKYAR